MAARRKDPPGMSADEFQAIMDVAGLTLKEAGAALGLSISSVNRLLRGEVPITADRAARIRARLQPKPPAAG